MKGSAIKFLGASSVLLVFLLALALAADGPYRLLKEIPIGGEGG